MLVVRSATPADLDALLLLSAQTGHGMTTMPADRTVWQERLAANSASFHQPVNPAQQQTYFFVLEDTNEQKIVGTSALYNNVGVDRPFYSYKISKVTTASTELAITLHLQVLHLVNDFTGCTEIGSLFLLPEYRQSGIGQFLARSRFMLLADFPERFSDVVFAELRGWIDETGKSPFWEFLGRKFFGLSFENADLISAVNGSQFISDLMPKYPIYVNLLSESARDVISKPNDGAVAAMKILDRENFQRTQYVDIFDAGPAMQCQADRIKTVMDSQICRVSDVADLPTLQSQKREDQYILSNQNLTDYRMMLQTVVRSGDEVIINRQTAEHLKVDTGSSIRIIKLIE